MNKSVKKMMMASAAVAFIAAVNAPVDAVAAKGNKEKCYGIVAKGKNDCAANGHSCGGYAAVDNDPNEWILVPKGLCDRIAGGSTTKPE